MNDNIDIFISSKIKPTIAPLFREIIVYISELNMLEDEKIETLIDRTVAGEVDNPTEELQNILLDYLYTVASTYGIICDSSHTTIRDLFTILTALDSIPNALESDKQYITDVLESDISPLYKMVNILSLFTPIDKVTISAIINKVTPTLLENLAIVAKVKPDEVIRAGEILNLLLDINRSYVPIGANIFNTTNELDESIDELIRIHGINIDISRVEYEVYSLLILGRDSRFKVLEKFDEIAEKIMDEKIINSVREKVNRLNEKHKDRVKELFS